MRERLITTKRSRLAIVVFGICCSLAIARATPSAQQTRSLWDGVYSEAQAKRGGALYNRSCAVCHGADLKGGDRAPALAGPAFAGRWTDRTVGALFEYTSVMMPVTSPGGFSPQQNADLVAFLLSKGGYPPGGSDLPSDMSALLQIAFVSSKQQVP
jgi:mono/diheme cytochrome c family protein